MPVLTLVTPPTAALLSLDDLAAHLRVTGTDELGLVQSLHDAAVAHLDGWHGVLGRAIMSQQWRQDFAGYGSLRLALPDVSAVTVSAVDGDGAALTVTAFAVKQDSIGWYVDVEGAGTPDRVSVTMTCALPSRLLPAVRMAVKLMVGHWFANREAVADAGFAELPMGVDALLMPLRWGAM